MTTNEKEVFFTSDLALIVTLSLYFPIESTELIGNKKISFVFQKSPELDRIVDLYWRGDIRIEPQQFFNQLKVIKTRIYSHI
jgi:hypothetical protein